MTGTPPSRLGCHLTLGLGMVAGGQELGAGSALQLDVPDLLYMNAFTVCWGVSLLQDSVSGLWDAQERLLHFHVLGLRAIHLGLWLFAVMVGGSAVVMFSVNTTTFAFLSREGGTHSPLLNFAVQQILDWAEAH